jgi:hypothetical protein
MRGAKVAAHSSASGRPDTFAAVSLPSLARTPTPRRAAPNADRSELAGSADAALEARQQRGRYRRSIVHASPTGRTVAILNPTVGLPDGYNAFHFRALPTEL